MVWVRGGKRAVTNGGVRHCHQLDLSVVQMMDYGVCWVQVGCHVIARAVAPYHLKVLSVEAHLEARAAAGFVPGSVREALFDVHPLQLVVFRKARAREPRAAKGSTKTQEWQKKRSVRPLVFST
jgi:hypothetical protein